MRRAARSAIASTLVVTVAAGVWLRWPQPVPSFDDVRAAYRPSEAFLLDRHGLLLDRKRIDFGVRRFGWVELNDVSPGVVDAVVAGEDAAFWRHGGVDAWALLAAARDGVWHGRLRGASTISMQLVTLLDAQADPATAATRRSLSGKVRQMRRAWSIEASWSKRQILEAYLNLLQFRGELQGIGAVSWTLSGKAPSGLSESEGAVLAALLPSPSADAQRIASRACARSRVVHPDADCDALRRIADRMLVAPRSEQAAERLAPHVAQSLLQHAGESVRTTLDARWQRLARDRLQQHIGALADRNVRDGAVLVVDNESGDVLAYVGSSGDLSRAPAVDGVRARRQAGSTLKPFLYELAIERRYLTAASLLDDSPVSLDTATGAYIPQNYDRDYKGLVSARTALASSLNIPAVRTLVLTGVEAFRDRLVELGYAGITRSGEYYGYSLALGSAEVSLWEQAQAYRALARGGVLAPLRLQADSSESSNETESPGQAESLARVESLGQGESPDPGERRVLDADAGFVVADMLSDRAARVVTFGLGSPLNTPFWSAVKTGTSKDMRDNWCIGFSDRYTVAVWVGNFEGDSMHDVTGVTGAGPVWQELMLALHADAASSPPDPPPGVERRAIAFAQDLEPPRDEWFLSGTASERVQPVRTGQPRITSPANGVVIALDPDIPERMQRVPISVADASPGLSLKLDGESLVAAGQDMLWKPRRGKFRVELEDQQGRVIDRVVFTVR